MGAGDRRVPKPQNYMHAPRRMMYNGKEASGQTRGFLVFQIPSDSASHFAGPTPTPVTKPSVWFQIPSDATGHFARRKGNGKNF